MKHKIIFRGFAQPYWINRIKDCFKQWEKDKKEEGYHATQVFEMGVAPVEWLEYRKPVKITIEC